MRILKIAGFVVLGLLAVVVAAAGAVAWGGAPLVASLVERAGPRVLGREIRIDGPFEIAWGNPIRIRAEGVHVANASWGSAPDMVAARRIELVLEPWPLLHLRPVIDRLALDGMRVLLEKNEAGEANWQFTGAKAATPQKRSSFPDLYALEVRDSTIDWRNGPTGAATELRFASLSVDTPERGAPVHAVVQGTFQHKPYALDARVGALAELQEPTKPYPVVLTGEIADTKIAIDGAIAAPLNMEGLDTHVVIEGRDLRPFLEVLSIPLPPTPPFRLAGRLKHEGDVWSGEEMDVALGRSKLTGGVSIDVSGKRPAIKAELVSPYLDLADVKGFTGEAPRKTARQQQEDTEKRKKGKGRVIPPTKLPTHQLGGFDADVTIDAAEIKPSGGVPFQRLTLALTLKDRELTLKPLRFAMANGDVTANLHWNARTEPGVLEADVNLRHFDLGKFFAGMQTAKQLKETKGIVGGFVKLRSRGGDERAIAANATGELGLFMQEGQFSQLLTEALGLDAAEAFGFLVAGDKPNPVNCLASHFDIADGVATVRTFILDTKDTVVDARGNINLGSETLYLDLMPHPKGLDAALAASADRAARHVRRAPGEAPDLGHRRPPRGCGRARRRRAAGCAPAAHRRRARRAQPLPPRLRGGEAGGEDGAQRRLVGAAQIETAGAVRAPAVIPRPSGWGYCDF
jgi:uncharacterized protein involved in outer membrane biogenesis